MFEKYRLIETNSKIISNSNSYTTQKLTIPNSSEGFIIFEKILI